MSGLLGDESAGQANYYLFLVNPKLAYNPYPDWERWAEDLAGNRRVWTTWNTGGRRGGIKAGDQALIVKVGQDPRGLVAIGTLTGEIYTGPHWNPEAKLPETGFVDLEITTLFDLDDPVPLELLEHLAPQAQWTPRQSGTRLPSSSAQAVVNAAFAW